VHCDESTISLNKRHAINFHTVTKILNEERKNDDMMLTRNVLDEHKHMRQVNCKKKMMLTNNGHGFDLTCHQVVRIQTSLVIK
jgi:hypothetical protein